MFCYDLYNLQYQYYQGNVRVFPVAEKIVGWNSKVTYFNIDLSIIDAFVLNFKISLDFHVKKTACPNMVSGYFVPLPVHSNNKSHFAHQQNWWLITYIRYILYIKFDDFVNLTLKLL